MYNKHQYVITCVTRVWISSIFLRFQSKKDALNESVSRMNAGTKTHHAHEAPSTEYGPGSI